MANVSYMAACKTCEAEGIKKVYYGETSRNLHVRSKEHYKDCGNKNKLSWMRKHIREDHEDKCSKCDFSWKVIGSFKKPMLRQLSEAIHINNTEKKSLMNLKNEYFKNSIESMKIANQKEEIQCDQCGRHMIDKRSLMGHMKDFHERLQCKQCQYKAFGQKDLNGHIQYNHTESTSSNANSV